MTLTAACFLVIGFLGIALGLGVVARAQQAIALSRRAVADLGNPDLDDDTKEKLIQNHAKRLFGLFFVLLAILATALFLPAMIVWGFSLLGWVSFDAVMRMSMSWQFIVGASIVGVTGWWWLTPRKNADAKETTTFENQYSASEQLLHRIVFKSTSAQLAMSDIEDKLYRKQLEPIAIDRPVFVTALPRAGTTMLLNLLSELPEFATHCYRDMPFVAAPLLWSRLASHFHKNDAPRERAHGDGMSVSLDSPEAFEEMIWKLHWPAHYQSDRITPWQKCDDAEFINFFRNHMRKIIRLRSGQNGNADARYLSKNNVNIARLAALPQAMDSAIVLVPFRDPIQHAASLLRQHQRFLAIHEQDPFAREYMAGVGHFDFGASLKPIDFAGWMDEPGPNDPLNLGFWIRYWVVAYENVLLQMGPRVRLIGYDRLCENPGEGIERLATLAEVSDRQALQSVGEVLDNPSRRDVDTSDVDRFWLNRATDVLARLEQASDAQIGIETPAPTSKPNRTDQHTSSVPVPIH